MPRGLFRRAFVYFKYGGMNRVAKALKVLKEISSNRGVLIPQIALAWILRHENTVAIPGAKKEEEQVKQTQDLQILDSRKRS